MANIWLADHCNGREAGRLAAFWRRLFPRRWQVGALPGGEAVWLLEVPFAADEWNERAARWLARRLRRLAKRERRGGGEFCLGLPLGLAERMAAEYPEVLAAGRLLSCRVLVEKLAARYGSLRGREVGLLGIGEAWQGFVAAELMRGGARVAASGTYAEQLAAEYWRQGVALPVLSARKLLQSCDTVILFRDLLPPGAEKLHNERLVPFVEPLVYVPGKFSGRFAFGMFPAGMAAAFQKGQ